MAVKKTASAPKKVASAPKKAAAPVKAAPKKAAAPTASPKGKAAAPKAAPKAALKAAAPKAAAPKTAPKKAAPQKAPAVRPLSPSQADMLKRVHGTGETGFPADKKAEQKTLDALQTRKLVKKGAKNKDSGHHHYSTSVAGKKHLETAKPGTESNTGPGTTPPATGS